MPTKLKKPIKRSKYYFCKKRKGPNLAADLLILKPNFTVEWVMSLTGQRWTAPFNYKQCINKNGHICIARNIIYKPITDAKAAEILSKP